MNYFLPLLIIWCLTSNAYCEQKIEEYWENPRNWVGSIKMVFFILLWIINAFYIIGGTCYGISLIIK